MKKSALRRILRLLMSLVLLLGIGAGGWTLFSGGAKRHQPIEGQASSGESTQHLMSVKTIKPKFDPNFRISAEELATVEPYFSAGLRSRVAGVVQNVYRAVGEEVVQGELLIEIDVPDLQKELEQKDAVVHQRTQELKVAKAQIKQAEAMVRVAQASVQQKRVEVTVAETLRDFRAKRLKRLQDASNRGSISPDIIDEQEREYLSAQTEVQAAGVGVSKALADVSDKEASLEAALVDIELKQSLVEVARKDRERVAAMKGYTRITAPFSGVVTRRNVDPGDFVPNSASSTGSESLMVVERTDVVTVAAKVPDNTVAYLSRDTEAVIELDDRPGMPIRGKVTRFAPSVDGSDRTVRVEVDLFNGGRTNYRRQVGNLLALWLAPVGDYSPHGAALSLALDSGVLRPSHKGGGDSFPAFPDSGSAEDGPRLYSGMTGTMRLALERFTDAHLLPSSAVFTIGGKPFLLLFEDGKAKRVPVRIQINDGQLVKVALLPRGGTGSSHEQARELSGQEEIIASRQAEISDGQPVRAVPGRW